MVPHEMHAMAISTHVFLAMQHLLKKIKKLKKIRIHISSLAKGTVTC